MNLAHALLLSLAACGPSSVDVGDEAASGCVDCDTDAPVDTSAGWPALRVNELMADNVATVQDDAGAWSDWVELYNPTSATVDLDGWTLTDDLDAPYRHTLSGVEVPAGGHVLLWADDAADLGPRHLAFSLAAAGEAVGLYAPDGESVDGVTFGQQAADVSLARLPDGGDTWQLAMEPTPGAPNGGNR